MRTGSGEPETCEGTLKRRAFLRAGLTGLSTLTLSDLLRLRGNAGPAGTSGRALDHRRLALGRPEPPGDLRPQARGPGGVPRPVRRDPDQRAGHPDHGEAPAAGRDRGQVLPDPIVRPRQPRARERHPHGHDGVSGRTDRDAPLHAQIPRRLHRRACLAGASARRDAAVYRPAPASLHRRRAPGARARPVLRRGGPERARSSPSRTSPRTRPGGPAWRAARHCSRPSTGCGPTSTVRA